MTSWANRILRREPAIIRMLFFLAPCITLLAPLATVSALILLSSGCVAIALLHRQSVSELLNFNLVLALFAVVALYLLINATWSLDPSRAFSKVLWFALVVMMTFAASRALGGWNDKQIRIAVIAFLAGISVGLAFVLVELATESSLTRLLFNMLPITRPSSFRKMGVEDGQIVRLAAFELNRNVAVMLLMLWPALLCLTRLADKPWRNIGIAVLIAGTAAATMFSEHETSKIALVVSAAVFVLARFWTVPVRWTLLVCWCLVLMLVVPLASLAAKEELYRLDWLPYSAKARITLWGHTAGKVSEHPFFGVGLESARKLNAMEKQGPQGRVLVDEANRRALPVTVGFHAHNAFLQTWYELGVVGAILLLAAGSAVIGYIGQLARNLQPFMLAEFAAFFAIAATGWGMWQSWLMALTGLAALYAVLAVNFARGTAPANEFRLAARSSMAPGERAA